jgi:hypothetical protein
MSTSFYKNNSLPGKSMCRRKSYYTLPHDILSYQRWIPVIYIYYKKPHIILQCGAQTNTIIKAVFHINRTYRAEMYWWACRGWNRLINSRTSGCIRSSSQVNLLACYESILTINNQSSFTKFWIFTLKHVVILNFYINTRFGTVRQSGKQA